MGRPRKELNQKLFENLCRIQCTLEEISSVLDCSEDTVERWCVRTYKKGFADIYKKYSLCGKSSLRRAQFNSATVKGNVTMQIWLGKQWLGQSENPENSIDTEDSDSYFAEAGLNANENN